MVPIHITEIRCEELKLFRFMLPMQVLNRDDIELYVEYGTSVTDPKQMAYRAWVSSEDGDVRGLLQTGRVDAAIDNEDIQQKIVLDICTAETFIPLAKSFFAWLEADNESRNI